MPQLEKVVIKERARLLRLKGQERLASFLATEVGATRHVLMETGNSGRTEHFATVRFVQELTPGAIVRATISGRSDCHLEARLAA